jgi:AGCS family alanine or glycine:cation symporter
MIFDTLSSVNEFIWGYVAFILIFALGSYFSIRSGFFQVIHFGPIFKSFVSMFKENAEKDRRGVHPLKIFFASIGGCIGIGCSSNTQKSSSGCATG